MNDHLERELAAHRLLHRYIAAVDACDPDALAALFAPDGTLIVRGVEMSGDGITAFYRERLTVPTLHFVTGVVVSERTDGLVASECGLFAIEMGEGGWTGVAGRYDDLIQFIDGRAAFARRTITIARRLRLGPTP